MNNFEISNLGISKENLALIWAFKFRINKIRNNSICHQTCGFWASTDQVMFRFQGGNQQGQTVHKNFQTAGVC